jgi:8-amino-7-oxononanoate synthase
VSLFDKFAAQRMLQASLAEGGGVAPIATPMDAIHSATSATIGGRRLVLAGTNNYLGLTFDAECRAAAIAAIEASGTGTTGSRMASGNYAGHRALERALAEAFGWASGIVFSTGYQANLGALSGLAGSDEFLLVDADSHASIHDGCRLSNATTIRFRHNDPEDLDRRLGRLGEDAKRTLVVVESLYSTRGDPAPLARIVEVKKRHGAWLLVDEAHSFGVFGPRGLGLCEELGLLDEVDFIVGTFSKSLGGVGGFCLSRHADLELLRMVSRPYIFTASSAPPAIAATHAALRRCSKATTCASGCGGTRAGCTTRRSASATARRRGAGTRGRAAVRIARRSARPVARAVRCRRLHQPHDPPGHAGGPEHRAHQPQRGAQRRRPLAHHRRARRSRRRSGLGSGQTARLRARPSSTSLTAAERRAGIRR